MVFIPRGCPLEPLSVAKALPLDITVGGGVVALHCMWPQHPLLQATHLCLQPRRRAPPVHDVARAPQPLGDGQPAGPEVPRRLAHIVWGSLSITPQARLPTEQLGVLATATTRI